MKSYLIKRKDNFMIKLDRPKVILMMDFKIKICLMHLEVEWVVWEVWAEWVVFKIFSKTYLGSKVGMV